MGVVGSWSRFSDGGALPSGSRYASLTNMRLRVLAAGWVGVALAMAVGCSNGPHPRPLVWQPVSGTSGERATINARALILHGQPICSRASYTSPLDIECDLELLKATGDHAVFEIRLVPQDGQPATLRIAWNEPPLRLVAGQPYLVRVAVAPKQRVTVNDLELPVPKITLPNGPFQIELTGEPSSGQWRLRRFTVR